MNILSANVKDLEIQNGDVILFSGTGTVSKIIEWFTDSRYSHAGIISFDGPGQNNFTPHVIEALEKGIVVNSLYADLKHYTGNVYLLRLTDEARATFKKTSFWNFLKKSIGTPYSYIGAIEAGLHDHLHRFHPKLRDEYFCSEFCLLALQAAGVAAKDLRAPDFTPADLAKLTYFDEPIKLEYSDQ